MSIGPLARQRTRVMCQITLVMAIAATGVLTACSGGGNKAEGGSMTQTSPSAATTAPHASTEGEGASCPAGLTMVSGQANIFGAGSDFAPGPGGESGGLVPPSVELPEGSSVVTIPTITGKVSPMSALVGYNGAGGDGKGATDITSYGGISGIVDRGNGQFLAGVFLTDEPPSTSAPERLDFTRREGFKTLAPRVAQTFFVGDGKDRTFHVPPGATRLFLGFADAFSAEGDYQGHPGYYDNNGGHLCVGVKVE